MHRLVAVLLWQSAKRDELLAPRHLPAGSSPAEVPICPAFFDESTDASTSLTKYSFPTKNLMRAAAKIRAIEFCNEEEDAGEVDDEDPNVSLELCAFTVAAVMGFDFSAKRVGGGDELQYNMIDFPVAQEEAVKVLNWMANPKLCPSRCAACQARSVFLPPPPSLAPLTRFLMCFLFSF